MKSSTAIICGAWIGAVCALIGYSRGIMKGMHMRDNIVIACK